MSSASLGSTRSLRPSKGLDFGWLGRSGDSDCDFAAGDNYADRAALVVLDVDGAHVDQSPLWRGGVGGAAVSLGVDHGFAVVIADTAAMGDLMSRARALELYDHGPCSSPIEKYILFSSSDASMPT